MYTEIEKREIVMKYVDLYDKVLVAALDADSVEATQEAVLEQFNQASALKAVFDIAYEEVFSVGSEDEPTIAELVFDEIRIGEYDSVPAYVRDVARLYLVKLSRYVYEL